MFMNYCS